MTALAPKLALALLAAGCVLAPAALAQAQPGPDLGRIFEQADANHDGLVTRAEFEASRRTRFRVLDRNGDGYLSPADLPPGFGRLRPGAERLNQLIARFDTDHDGRISFDEFLAGSMRLFDAADANHNGVVTRAEAEAFVARFKTALAAKP